MLCSGHFDTEKMFFFRKMDVNVIAFSCSSSFVLVFLSVFVTLVFPAYKKLLINLSLCH